MFEELDRFKELAPSRSVLHRRVLTEGQHVTEAMMRDAFRHEEIVRIAYCPIVLGRLAIEYAERAAARLSALRVERTKQAVRVLRESVREWRYWTGREFTDAQKASIGRIEADFRERAERHIATLWFTVSNGAKAQVADWQDDPWTDVHVAFHIYAFACLVYRRNATLIDRRMGIRYNNRFDIAFAGVGAALLGMTDGTGFHTTELSRRCVTILDNAMKTMSFGEEVAV